MAGLEIGVDDLEVHCVDDPAMLSRRDGWDVNRQSNSARRVDGTHRNAGDVGVFVPGLLLDVGLAEAHDCSQGNEVFGVGRVASEELVGRVVVAASAWNHV